MWKKIVDLLRAPVFPDDDEKTHAAALLNSIVLSVLVATLFYTVFARVAVVSRLLLIVIPLLLLQVGLLVLIRRGRVRVAGGWLVSGVWLILFYASYINGGVRAPAFSGFIVVVMIAAFLFNARLGMIVAGLSVAGGIILILLEESGLLPIPAAPHSLFSVLLAQVTYFIVAAVLLALATRNVRQALIRARLSEERYRLIASIMSDYAFSIEYGPNGEIKDQWLGGAFEAITGYKPEEYFKRGGWTTIVHPDDKEQDEQDMSQLRANQKVITEVRLTRKDGQVRWVRAYGHPLWDDKNNRLTGLYGAVQDITEHKLMEQTLRQRAEEMFLLYQISLALTSEQDLYHALRAFVQELKRVMAVDAFHIGLYDAQTDVFSYSLFLNLGEDLQLPPRSLRSNPGLTWEVISSRQTLYLTDITDPEIQRKHNILIVVDVGIRSYTGIPLILQDRVIGIMSVQSIQPNAYTSDQIRLLETLAAQVAITIEKTGLLDQLKQELVDRQRIEASLRQRESILDAVAVSAEQLLKTHEWREEIDAMLARLGKSINASHAYFFGNRKTEDGRIFTTMQYEWTAPGFASDLENPVYSDAYMSGKDLTSWYQNMSRGLPYVGDQKHLNETDYQYLTSRQMLAMLDIPVYVDNEWLGSIGVDEMSQAREWTNAEIDILKTAANVLGAAIKRQKDETALQNELNQRKVLIEELKIRNAESETLRESAAIVAATLEKSEAVDRILEQLERVVHYNSASVQLLHDNVLEIVSFRGADFNVDDIGTTFVLDENEPSYPVIQERVPYILYDDVQISVPTFNNIPHNNIHGWLAIPLKVKGQIIGIIALDGQQVGQFSERDAKLAVTYANQVAIALENARLFSELQEKFTERQKLIEELESKNAELERFTYTVSHDLRSPLVTIKGFLGYLERSASSGNMENFRRDKARISAATDRMDSLLKDLLELSRVGRQINRPETVLFEDLVNEAAEIVHGRLEARNITLRTQPNLPRVHVDRRRLIEVLQNLIDNAAKYVGTQKNPMILIGTHGTDGSGQPVFFVRDNGMGIAPEYHERIFRLFDKLDPDSEGTGIGLALVKRIIEFHGGRIWVESEAEQGSTFYFTLPPAGT